MKKTVIILSAITTTLLFSCGNKTEEKNSEGENPNKEINEDAAKMCECYKAGLNDTQKYMECSTENEKIREKYIKDPEKIKQYDIALSECMK